MHGALGVIENHVTSATVPVPAMIWPRILVFTSMMLRVLNPAAFGSYGAGIYIPKLGLVPKHVRPVRPVANLYDLLATYGLVCFSLSLMPSAVP